MRKFILTSIEVFMLILPFIGLLFHIHARYDWFDRNKHLYLWYQIPVTFLVAWLIAFGI